MKKSVHTADTPILLERKTLDQFSKSFLQNCGKVTFLTQLLETSHRTLPAHVAKRLQKLQRHRLNCFCGRLRRVLNLFGAPLLHSFMQDQPAHLDCLLDDRLLHSFTRGDAFDRVRHDNDLRHLSRSIDCLLLAGGLLHDLRVRARRSHALCATSTRTPSCRLPPRWPPTPLQFPPPFLSIGGFTPASSTRCRKTHRPLRCHGHCEACQHKGTVSTPFETIAKTDKMYEHLVLMFLREPVFHCRS